jgi:hypothetical protein
MLDILLAECESRSRASSYRWTAGGVERRSETLLVPVYRFLMGEIHRQRSNFEVATQIFRSLSLASDDVLLGWYCQQQEAWCREGLSLKQPLEPFPRFAPEELEPPSGKYKFIVAGTVRPWRDSVSAWVKFPDGAMTVEDLTCLAAAASVCSSLAGIVVMESDVSARWPGTTGTQGFIKTLVKLERAAPWLIVGPSPAANVLTGSLRSADLRATCIAAEKLTELRFRAWAAHGKRSAERAWRRSVGERPGPSQRGPTDDNQRLAR